MSDADGSERFAAKLLFQFRVVSNGKSNKRRTCEERIINFQAVTADAAWRYAKDYGRKEQHNYKNDSGGTVRFEFVGIADLQHLGAEVESEEVWYDIVELLEPKERSKKFVPKKRDLNVFKILSKFGT